MTSVKKLWPAQHHPARLLRMPNGKQVAIDLEILAAVRKLNQLGAVTNFCCQGDQRERDYRGSPLSQFCLGAYVSLAKGSFPPSLIEIARAEGLHVESHYLAGPNRNGLTLNQVRANNRRFVRILRKWAMIR